jgi:hypothetical protein
MDKAIHMEQPASGNTVWKRVWMITAEVLLVVLTLAMMGAILLPVFMGASSDMSDGMTTPTRRR